MRDSDQLTPFGQLLRSARLQRDLTMKKAGEGMGMIEQRVYDYECGRRIPGKTRSLIMAKFYGIPLEEFFAKMEEGK